MNCTSGKKYHATERSALNHLTWARKQRHQEGSTGLKHLNVYQCEECAGWHVGRAWRGKREAQAAQPAAKKAKGPTPGQQRRAATKAAEKAAKQQMYADYTDNLRIMRIMTDREIARMEALGYKPRTPNSAQ